MSDSFKFLINSNMQIHINPETCIKCGSCVAVCPVGIFRQSAPRMPVTIVNPETCIKCGHCVDVCPTNSIEHECFPPERLHEIDYQQMPSPEQLMNLIHARRSNRTFLKKEVPADAIAMMREAALYAPTAGNNQLVELNVINDPEKITDIIRFTIDTLGEHLDLLGENYANVVSGARQAFENGIDIIARNAPYVMVFASDHSFGSADCNLAYENASLMAQSLGVSQFYMGFVMTATSLSDPDSVKALFGVKQKVQALMGFGLPRLRYKRYAERG